MYLKQLANKQLSHIKINQTQSLYNSVNFCTVRIGIFYLDIPHFIVHSFISWLTFGVILCLAVINIYMQVFDWMYLYSPIVMERIWLLVWQNHCLIIWGLLDSFSKFHCDLTSPKHCVRFYSFHIFDNTCYMWLLGSMCISLVANVMGCVFLGLLDTLSPLGECLFKSFAYFQLSFFFSWAVSILDIFYIQTPHQILGLKYLTPSCGCQYILYHSLIHKKFIYPKSYQLLLLII